MAKIDVVDITGKKTVITKENTKIHKSGETYSAQWQIGEKNTF